MKMATCICILFAAGTAWAQDEVVLKNGDRVSGRIVGAAGGKITIETDHSGTLSIDLGKVTGLSSEGKVKLRLSTGEILDGKLSIGEGGKIKVASEGAATPVEVEITRIVAINDPPVQWHGSFDIAGRATDGNTHTSSLLLSAEAVRATDIDEIQAKLLFRYGKTGGDLTERNSYGLAKYLYRMNPQFYLYASLEAFSDKFKDLDLRTVYSIGAGKQLIQRADLDLSVEAGIAYIDSKFGIEEDDGHLGARLAGKVRYSLGKGWDLTDTLTGYPNFEDTQDWQLHNELAVGAPLGGGWTFKAGMITDIDNDPGDDIEKVDNTYFAGVGYKF